ncbi:MAG: ATP-binding cassette domain-containing protein [Bacteroidetes bacterium]|nr:ATP-binding cassette domain-containing protein [Bacteroidota bacterium]
MPTIFPAIRKKNHFDDVNVTFKQGNCYGIIGANGAGKSTFMKILSGDLEPNKGSVSLETGKRMAVLKQNHREYDNVTVLNTVLMGHTTLWKIMQEKDAIYMKEDFSEADGFRASELEEQFAEMDGWNAESSAANLLSGIGIKEADHYKLVSELDGNQKVRFYSLRLCLAIRRRLLLTNLPTTSTCIPSGGWKIFTRFKNTVLVVSPTVTSWIR